MTSSFRVYVVATTILTMAVSTFSYVPYSNQPQGYYGPSQWNAPQSDYRDHVQTGYFQQPARTQDWVSRGYQHSGYEPNMYSPAPVPAMYHHSALGYPMRSSQSTPNAYGSAISSPIGASYPQQLLPPQSQPMDVDSSGDSSKFKIFHLPLPSSHHTKTLQLPITGDASRFRVVHVNPQGAMSEAQPSRSDDGVSSGALEYLSRAKSDIERIESNSDAYHEILYSKGNQKNSQLSTSNSEAQAISSARIGSGKQDGGSNSNKSYLAHNYQQNNGHPDGSHTQLGPSNNDAQANASSSANRGTGNNNGETYPVNISSQGYGNQGRGYTQQETSNSNAQDNAPSNSGNLDTRYNNGESHLTNTYSQNDNQERATTHQKPGYSGAQATDSASSISSPTKGYIGDESYHINNYPKSYVNQYEGYNNGKSSPINNNNEKYYKSQDGHSNDESYPAYNNNNHQDYRNQNVAPNSDKSYPVNNNDWKNSDNIGGSPNKNDPADKNNLQDFGLDDQAPDSGESYHFNNRNGQAPINQDESPNNAETYIPTNAHRHVPVNRHLKPTSSSTAQPTAAATSKNGPTQVQQTDPHYRHHQYPNSSTHKGPNHGSASKYSPINSQISGTAAASSSSVTQTPSSRNPVNNLHIHGGPPIVHPRNPDVTQPNSNKTALKLPLHGGPPKFHHVSPQSPNFNQPAHKLPIQGGPNKFHPTNSHKTSQLYPKDSDQTPSTKENGNPDNPLTAMYSPTDDSLSDLDNKFIDFNESLGPVDDYIQPELSPTDETYAPIYDVSSGLSQSDTSLVPTIDGINVPTDYLPDAADGSSKNTQPEPRDSKNTTYSNPYYEGNDDTGIQSNVSTASKDAGSSSPINQSDWTYLYPDENIANPQVPQDYPSFPLSESTSSFKNPSGKILSKTTVEAFTDDHDASNEDYNGVGSLSAVPDSLASTDKNGGSSTSNPTKETNVLSLFNPFTDKSKPKLTPTSMSALPSDDTSAGSYDRITGNPDNVSSDVGALLGYYNGTVNKKNTLKSQQILNHNPDNIDKDNAGNPTDGMISNAQVQALVQGVSKTKNITPSFDVASSSYATNESDAYSGPLRVLYKIITALEKLFVRNE